jgi:hypothetical protein
MKEGVCSSQGGIKSANADGAFTGATSSSSLSDRILFMEKSKGRGKIFPGEEVKR